MYHLNSTLHMWNFIPKSDDTILVYLWLLTRRLSNNVHSLVCFFGWAYWDQADELFYANEMAEANSW